MPRIWETSQQENRRIFGEEGIEGMGLTVPLRTKPSPNENPRPKYRVASVAAIICGVALFDAIGLGVARHPATNFNGWEILLLAIAFVSGLVWWFKSPRD